MKRTASFAIALLAGTSIVTGSPYMSCPLATTPYARVTS